MPTVRSWWVLAAGLLWLSYTLHGFRPPWQPLVESDADSGGAIRQVLFLGCGALAWYHLLLQGKWSQLLRTRTAWIVLAIMLAATMIYAERPVLTCKRAILFACGLVVLLALVQLPRDPVRFLLWGCVTTVGLLAWASLAMWAVLPAEHWQTTSRPGLAGVAGHPNTLGPALAVTWVLSLGLCERPMTRLWAAQRLMQAGVLVALFLTDSIGSYGVAIAGTAFFAFMNATSYLRAVIGLGATCCLPVIALEGAAISEGLLHSMGRDTSLSGRDVLWTEIGREFFERPILGSGFGSFWYEGRGREIVGTWNPRQSHNAYLDLSLDLGLLGAVLVCGLIAVAVLRGWKRYVALRLVGMQGAHASLLAAVLSLLLIGAFSESYLLKMDKFQFFVMAWAVLTLDVTHVVRVPRNALQFART